MFKKPIKTGSANLDEINHINQEEINLKKEQYEQIVSDIRNSGIDIDSAVEFIKGTFKDATKDTTKAFLKVAKKNVPKLKMAFISENVVPHFVGIYLIDEAFEDVRDAIGDPKFMTYLLGLYVIVHAKLFEAELDDLIRFSLAEMLFYTAIAVSEQIENAEVE
jgi:hypothetical protein